MNLITKATHADGSTIRKGGRDTQYEYDGYFINSLELSGTIRTLEDIDWLIKYLQIHRDGFHIAGKSINK